MIPYWRTPTLRCMLEAMHPAMQYRFMIARPQWLRYLRSCRVHIPDVTFVGYEQGRDLLVWHDTEVQHAIMALK